MAACTPTSDAICAACTRCRATEYETQPCTATSNRVCQVRLRVADLSLLTPSPPPHLDLRHLYQHAVCSAGLHGHQHYRLHHLHHLPDWRTGGHSLHGHH